MNISEECFKEIVKLVEEYINEVSIANLQNTASRVLDDREFNAMSKIPRFNSEDPGDLESVYSDEKYADASRIVHHMPDPKGDTANTSANKLFKAAWKSLGKRREAYHKAKPDTPEFSKASKRYYRASNYTAADPVVARHRKYNKSEALEEVLEILEDLYSKIKDQPQEKRADLEAKYAKMKQKEGKGMLQRILDQRKAMTKQEKGQEKTKDRSEKALGNYKDEWSDYRDNTPHMYQFEALEILENIYNELNLEEADHHAHSKNPVVKITDKNYKVASGKSLPGPFNKNHVGQYIVYNKDTDASYLVTPDNWKKSKIKRDLERQGKFYEALEETFKILELFDRPDLLNDIDTALGSPVKKTFKKILTPKKEKKITKKKVNENFDNFKEISYNIEEALSLIEAIINEVSDKKHKYLVDELEDGIKKVEEIKGLAATKADKDNLDGIIVKQKHRLEVSKDKRNKRVTDRKREEYEDSKKEEGK